ncbi:hypothetical protein I2I11_07505 [Pontibacter sp. 172403-2]|uniref:hypothetical protein n=1 Tax=Pontibacter rufus TaxID=2791028 RepID=UPI0018AF613D|nr:hypothetical protein [Pontibacter sp. 172403-2]MBF9253134.1 hypothetical protein [Pontibacter sp. 172403-2]
MNQKLVNSILLSLAFVAAVIGAHRSITYNDIVGNYWIFMVALVLFILWWYRRKKYRA